MEDAQWAWKRLGVAPNIMTPDGIAYGWTADGDLWEVANGTGLVGQPISGVTVVDPATGRVATGSRLFNADGRDNAADALTYARGLEQGRPEDVLAALREVWIVEDAE